MNKDTSISRRHFIGSAIAASAGISTAAWSLPSGLGHARPLDVTLGLELLRSIPVIDIHSHPGRSFLAHKKFDNPIINQMRAGFESERLADMQAGHVTCSLFATVSDIQVLDVKSSGNLGVAREFYPNEAFNDFNQQLNYFSSLIEEGVLSLALSAHDIRQAHRKGQRVAVLSSEGAGFVEDKLERLSLAYDAGMRSVTLIHYRPSEYGDNQTSAPIHGGLTALGGELVQEMNRLGMIIDMAHASFETVRDVVELSEAPIMISHSHLSTKDNPHPRLLNPEHAMLIVEHEGIIGSWPSGIINQSMSDFVDQTLRLIDLVGIDHVAIGTDLDANYKPVLTDYSQFPEFATRLLSRGLSKEEAGKILGLNFLRLFENTTSKQRR